jgi:DNA invertase Pin-like site-specific DNA recombinase
MNRQAKRAFSYIRFSDSRQARGDSLRRQLDWGKSLCQTKGWVLDDSLTLQDLGVSAFRGQNAATGHLAAFREAIRMKKVMPGDVLLLESLDRLSREDIDPAWELFRSILKSGVEVYTREPERHYVPDDLSNFGTRIEVQAYMLRAYNESATKSMRGKSYWAAKRAELAKSVKEGINKKPIHKVIPAWLRISADEQRFEVIPEAAKTIKLIYRWAGEGLGLDSITARLNKEGHKPIGNNIRREVFKDSWSRSYVAKLLRDKTVVGEFQPHVMKMVPVDAKNPDGPLVQKRVPLGDPIPDYFPQIISETEWYRIRHGVEGRAKARGRTGVLVASLFTGLIRDARDGTNMHLIYTCSPRKQNARKLVSFGSRNGWVGSVHKPFPYDWVERAFLATLSELKVSELLDGKIDEREEKIAALTGKLQELDQKIVAVQQRVVKETGIDALVTLLEKLDKERKDAAAERDRLKKETSHQQPAALDEAQSLIDLLKTVPDEERKTLRNKLKSRIRQLVSNVWMLVWDATPAIRAADLQIVFHSGKVRALLLAWRRRGGKYRGIVTGIHAVVAKKEGATHLADKSLANYRTDPATRKFFEEHRKRMGPAIQKVIVAEIKVREAADKYEKFERTRKVPKKDAKRIRAKLGLD